MAGSVPEQPDIWSNGSREPILHLDIEVAGAGVFYAFPSLFSTTNGDMGRTLMACAGIAGALQTVQSAEYWGVVLALQALSGVHIDNLLGVLLG